MYQKEDPKNDSSSPLAVPNSLTPQNAQQNIQRAQHVPLTEIVKMPTSPQPKLMPKKRTFWKVLLNLLICLILVCIAVLLASEFSPNLRSMLIQFYHMAAKMN
jgi:hypothetical protein